MVSFCAFSAHDAQLSADGCLHFTVFGGARFRRPPVAHLIAERRRRTPAPPDGTQYFFVTLFGETSITWPTLAEELLAVCEALDTGTLALSDWDHSMAQPELSGLLRVHALTLFGGFDANHAPSEEAELDALTLQRHTGHIPEEAVELLMLGIGHTGTQRLVAVRNALAAMLAEPA